MSRNKIRTPEDNYRMRRKKSYRRNKEYIFSINFEKNGFYKCEECGKAPLYKNKTGESIMRDDLLTCDHIIELSKGGTNEINNLRAVCHVCNNTKSNQADVTYSDVS